MYNSNGNQDILASLIGDEDRADEIAMFEMDTQSVPSAAAPWQTPIFTILAHC